MLPFKETLVIIPTYNEFDNIGKMIVTLFELYPEISLLIVDDGSPDATADVVKQYGEKFSGNLFLIEREGKLGIATAYTTGFRWALDRGYNYIFEMDCDFSHDPLDIPILLKEASDNDLVIGSRYIGGVRVVDWPLKRLLLSYGASLYTRFITGIPVFDTTGGFKCFTRKALCALDLDDVLSNGYIFQLELNYKLWVKGMKVKEVPIIFRERRKGESKMGRGIIFEALVNVIKLRFKKIMGTL